jgi:valyl-tRNA synthetase
MDSRYDHIKHEQAIYKRWEESGAFTPPPAREIREKKLTTFSIIMPPPNANDPLHVGHAMFVTVEDILTRYHRMKGEATLWLPGTDHAGIETQYVFEKKLKKEGKSRFSYDRETLYQMIWDYVQENSQVALQQMKQLGASADWSRTKFTLDPDIVDLVLSTFERMHEEKLVYRDLALVNYCTKCGTAYSQLEINHEERTTPLYFMKYGPFTLATVRPETKFGDTAVAVNPDDSRYKQWIGKEIAVEGLLGTVRMKVIADDYVDPQFGTGVVKITPAHDPNDFEVWQRHRGEIPGPKQVIGFDGKLNELTGKYQGMKVNEARAQVVKDLEEKGLLVKTNEAYQHSIGVCYRCGTAIEPLPLAQFFVTVEPLTKQALGALDSGEAKILGSGHDKILRHWLTNLKDWNISRQIVWGIRMPVWYEVPGKREGLSEEILRQSGTGINTRSAQDDPADLTSLSAESSINNQIVVGFLDKDGTFTQGIIGELLERYDFAEIEAGLQTLMAPANADFVVSRDKPAKAGLWLQETDTFDTWFSSSQWPVVTLAAQSENREQNEQILRQSSETRLTRSAQDDTADFKSVSAMSNTRGTLPFSSDDFELYYPTSVMETGYDILPFWVMRMMMMGLYLTGKSPFEKVYLHGLVRDEKGQKMSKSKGNVVNPLDLVDQYGADALRMALVMSTTAGQDSGLGESKVRGMRNFANKIWNASRFIQMNRDNQKTEVNRQKQAVGDEQFGQQLNTVVERVTIELERMKIGQAAETVHNEFWHWYCDVALEQGKRGELSFKMMELGMKTFLTLLHPFMPFVTEAVWQELNFDDQLLIEYEWPRA